MSSTHAMPFGAQDRAALERMCAHLGIETSYRDAWGVRREVPEASLRALLADFGDGADEWRRSEPPQAQRPCHLPDALKNGGRIWGPAVQLYALRSQRNWGIGDFGDLLRLIEQWARRGASVIGLSPLHAMFPHDPGRASPYSPSSRLALNVLYIDVEAVEETRTGAARARVESAQFRERLARLREAELVDYGGVAAAKFEVLALAYADFRERHLNVETSRGRALREFQQREGEPLRRHALFEALQERFHANDATVWGWPAWPAEYRDPDGAAVRQFREQHLERVEYFEYLQWEAARQLERAVECCKALALAGGLYLDIAVSVDRGGAEAWANQQCYALGASVGAPPDAYNLKGQDWGLPAPRRRTREDIFTRALLEAMRYAGIVRIDHVMGLARLYCIPAGAMPHEGAYVLYDVDRMLSILAAESQRSRCMVIGEDLGTVPEGFRELLARSSVLSYRVLYFEREADGEFRAASAYPRAALAAVSTHDLPTLAGWWAGRDLEWRDRLALFPGEAQRKSQLEVRAADRLRLARALGVDAATTKPEAFSLAVHAYVARSPAMVVTVQLEDAFALAEQANLPGTGLEHPNWRRKLPVALEAMERDARVEALAGVLERERPLGAWSGTSPPRR